MKKITKGSIDKNCIDYIKKTESILKNGYYHCFDSFCFITYNSGNQKDLNVYQTVNLVLSKSLSELLKIDEESARNLISKYYDNARRFDTLNIIKELKGCNIIIADRHKIVCYLKYKKGGIRYKTEYPNKDKFVVALNPNQIKLADGSNTTFRNNPDIRYKDGGKTLPYVSDDFQIGYNGAYEHLIAPNGKPSNLTPEQYRLVRTTAFKEWFGDWEYDPSEASKVVDENGEPLVVYHGSEFNFNIFKADKKTPIIYFSTDKKYSELFGAEIYECFLNIKKMLDCSIFGLEIQQQSKIVSFLQEKGINIENKKIYEKYYLQFWKYIAMNFTVDVKNKFKEFYNGIKFYEDYSISQETSLNYTIFEPNQIKLADGSNTTFDGNNPDIRYADGGIINDFKYTIGGL